ncbi:MAG: zinc-dependent metalloprotease [Saprospiraceae bacterium]
MKKIMFTLAAAVSLSVTVLAQQSPGNCGTTFEDQLASRPRLRENLAAIESGAFVQDRTIQYVPIFFHLVGDVNGNGKHKERLVLDQLCKLNAAYAAMDIRFYLNPHPTQGLFDYSINNDAVYTTQTNFTLMQNRRHPNALNVYVVNAAESGNNQPGTTLAYYSSQRDWIVSRKDQINGNANNGTLPHEIGHFFSLNHTFFGYESNSFGPNDVTWPIAPVFAPNGGGVTTERQNGSNCSTAADEICDTPPDYNFGFEQGNCDAYTGGGKDPLGTLVDPMENNFMSYFSNCANYAFTNQQQAAILADRNSASRNYLDNTFVPASDNIDTPIDFLIGPADTDTVNYFNEVLLEWNPVAGATHYLLEIDITNAYATPNAQTFILTTTSKLLTNLQAKKKYFWRVRPFNYYVTCATPKQFSLITPITSATSDIAGLSAWQLSPNPLSVGDVLHLAVNADNGFEASVRIIDATGRQVYNQTNLSFNTGETVTNVPVAGLQNGLYFVVLENSQGRDVRRLVVLR